MPSGARGKQAAPEGSRWFRFGFHAGAPLESTCASLPPELPVALWAAALTPVTLVSHLTSWGCSWQLGSPVTLLRVPVAALRSAGSSSRMWRMR